MAQIRVYGTKWCPDCVRAKQVLGRYDIKYEWHDIENDAQACELVEKINGGYKSVPTIVFPDGSIMVEPSNAALEKKIQEM